MNRIIKEIFRTSLELLLVLLACFLLVKYVGQRTEVIGSSMETTLSDGDNLVVDKLSYRFGDPQRYDIIVFRYHYSQGTYYVKRIIGLPGERVRIDEEGYIYIDGGLLEESYGREKMLSPGLAGEEIILGEGEYFVLGDNRNNSSDSRDPAVGNILREEIMGKAWLQIWPLGEFGILNHQ